MVTVVGLAPDKVTTTLTSMLFITCIVCPLPLSRVTAPTVSVGTLLGRPCGTHVRPTCTHVRQTCGIFPCGTHVAPMWHPRAPCPLKRDRPRTL